MSFPKEYITWSGLNLNFRAETAHSLTLSYWCLVKHGSSRKYSRLQQQWLHRNLQEKKWEPLEAKSATPGTEFEISFSLERGVRGGR